MHNSLLCSESPNGVFHLVLNRPEQRNALDAALVESLIQQLETLAQKEEVRLVTFSGAGDHFCAGIDPHWMQQNVQASEKENIKDAEELARLFWLLYHFPKPTLAFVRGNVFSEGLGLVACADIALIHEHASFCFSETKIGLIPALISPYIIRAIGERQTRHYSLSAEIFYAKTALGLNLGHRLALAKEWEQEKTILIGQLLRNSPYALIKTKKLLHSLNPLSRNTKDITVKAIADMYSSQQGQEGVRAFLEKRNPPWIIS